MIPAHEKWVSRLALSCIVLALGLAVESAPSQAQVKQQDSTHSLNLTAAKSDSKFVQDNMKRINLVIAKSTLSKETLGQTNASSTKGENQVKSESNPADKKDVNPNTIIVTSSVQSSAHSKKSTVSTPTPKAASQISRGSSEVDNLIKRAMSLQGIPYLWGGTTREGFDCSGFVQYVFKASGVSLPRSSFEQYKLGIPVSRDVLKPGDLVFFSTYKSGASDVRIYIGGGRTIGSASDGVAIHSLSESYWSKHYLGARRVL